MTKATIAVLGIDLGKNTCSMAGLDVTRAVVLRREVTRDALIALAAALPPCTIAMEACCGAHFLGCTIAGNGHTVRLMSPEYVQPYVKAQKTDDRDSEAIAEAAATRPTMRFVLLKSEAQLDVQVLHRARERLAIRPGRHRLQPHPPAKTAGSRARVTPSTPSGQRRTALAHQPQIAKTGGWPSRTLGRDDHLPPAAFFSSLLALTVFGNRIGIEDRSAVDCRLHAARSLSAPYEALNWSAS